MIEPESDTTPAAPLKITGATFYPQQNGKYHRTAKFELVERSTPILRRGQNFYIALRYHDDKDEEREIDLVETDTLKLIFGFGPHPSPLNGTEQIVKIEGDTLNSDEGRWSGRIKGVDKNAITLEIRSSPDSCVGIWQCKVETGTRSDSGSVEKYLCPDDIYILFNPWNSSKP